MVLTEKRYKFDNFPVLRNSHIRGDCVYQVRLYFYRSQFMSQQAGMVRMQMLLGFIEAKAVVIDALIKSEDALDYLAILCSSPAIPQKFSAIIHKAAPTAIIEEMSRQHAEEHLASWAVREAAGNTIPFAGPLNENFQARRALLALLLEYRSLLAECSAVIPSAVIPVRRPGSRDFFIPFLMFMKEGLLCGMPDYQIEKIEQGSNGSRILHLASCAGKRLLVCEDVLCMKEIDVPGSVFTGRKDRGMYSIRAPLRTGSFDFTLVVPSLL